MTDELAEFTADESVKKKPRGKPLAKGYDERRWLKGRPKVPKDKARAAKIIESVIWEELSREIENADTREKTDALRLMIRSMIRNKQTQAALLDRVAGKVAQNVDVTSGGEKIKGYIGINPSEWDKDGQE